MHGSYWDLDHIIPLSSIDITNKEEVEKLCHYNNLQPLTKKHNYIKKDRILTKEENELLKLDLLK